jgi:hypothetical protein
MVLLPSLTQVKIERLPDTAMVAGFQVALTGAPAPIVQVLRVVTLPLVATMYGTALGHETTPGASARTPAPSSGLWLNAARIIGSVSLPVEA